jgi:hypothetical protein
MLFYVIPTSGRNLGYCRKKTASLHSAQHDNMLFYVIPTSGRNLRHCCRKTA